MDVAALDRVEVLSSPRGSRARSVPCRAAEPSTCEEGLETYPYTSLYAFNVWSIIGDFWEADTPFVAYGVVLLVTGLLLACVPLWQRRDVTTFLAAGTIAAFAFYFLPTRAHERYLFPAFVLLLPLAATRARLLWPYIVLSLGFALTLYFAFTRYGQNELRSPPWLETTLFRATARS